MSADDGLYAASQRSETDRQKEDELLTACYKGDAASVRALIDANVDVNATTGNNFWDRSALEIAALNGRLEIVNALISAGVDINRRDKMGRTVGANALENAATGGHLDVMNALISGGVDLSIKDELGCTVGENALSNAAEEGHFDVVNALISGGVDLNTKDKYGSTVGEKALENAAYDGHVDVVNALISCGVDVNIKDEERRTVGEKALENAAEEGHFDVVNALISGGVDVNIKDEEGRTVGEKALENAACRGSLVVVNGLISAGVDLNIKNINDETVGGQALVQAAGNGHPDIVNTLIGMGVDIKEANKNSETVGGQALVKAAGIGHHGIMNTLIEIGVDVNQANGKSKTVGGQALVKAAGNGHPDIVNTLIGIGVDLNQVLQNEKVGESALLEVLKCDEPNRGHLKIVDTFVRQEVHIEKQNTFIETCERKLRNLQETPYFFVTGAWKIALYYKMYELFTGKTKEFVMEAITKAMEQVEEYWLKDCYRKALTYYKNDIPEILSEVRLDEEQKMQMVEAFASGAERDYCVRSNFVGFTRAGKTSLMWQLFLKIFNPKDMESTNGIDISLGYCNINLRTREWKRPEESAEEKRARRFQAITDVNKTQEETISECEINSGIQTKQQQKQGKQKQQQQQQQKQQQQRNDNSIPQRKTNTTGKPTDVSVTKAELLGTAKPSATKADPHLIHRRVTQAKSKAGRIEQEANATGIDYAGQSTYYALHQLFLSKRGVNIIVLDGSKDFDEDILDEDVRHIGSKTSANSKDFLRFWAKSLRYYLPERSSKHIITVFTHKDLVLNQDDLQKKICIVKEIIQDMGMTDLFFETIFCINANDPKDIVLQELRDIILHFSTGENHWGQKMPSRWLLLEDKLMQKKAGGQQVMTLEEITDVHLKSALPLGSQDELLLFLKIHHEIGTLMYFADEGVTNIAILNPQWLIDSLKLIICSERFRDHRYVKQWDRLQEKGIVDKDFLYSVWESHRRERFYEFREDLVLLMNKLDLIASPKTYNEKGDYVLSPYFILPCMLHSAPKQFLQEYQNKATHRNLPLAFEFIHGFLPTATAYRVLATCVMEFGELKEEETIYCDAAVFKVFEHHYLTLEFTSSSIIANVLTFGKTRADIAVCKGVREFLEDALKCIVSSQRVPTNYSLLVACRNEDKHDKPVWLKWSVVMQKPEIICEKHSNKPPHVVKTDEILKQWSPTLSAEGRLQSKRRKIHEKPIPDEKPDHHYLGRVSRRIPSKGFQLLFMHLGLNLDDIDRKERESPKQCILLLLLEWARRPGSTYRQLADALLEQHNYVFDIEEMESCNCDWRSEFPETFLVKEVANCTDLEFDKVCLIAGSSYLELGLELGLQKHEIDVIKEDNIRCVPSTREVIKSWIDKSRPGDTWGVLGDALYEVGADPRFIKSICNARQETHS